MLSYCMLEDEEMLYYTIQKYLLLESVVVLAAPMPLLLVATPPSPKLGVANGNK